MKVLGVVGSPRKDGNCDILVKAFLDAVDADTEYIFLNEKSLRGCNACDACRHGDCVIPDDGNEIIQSLLSSDMLVFASPIYYGHITAQATAFVNRFYQTAYNPNKSLRGKKIITIYTQAQPSDMFDATIEAHEKVYDFLGFERVGRITARGLQKKGDRDELAEYIQAVKQLARDVSIA